MDRVVWLNQTLRHSIRSGRFKQLEDDSITPFALKVALAANSDS